MDTPAAIVEPPPITPLGPVLHDDRTCVQCSYNLRGLPYAGNCPECGTPVVNSLRGILLQYASPDYLKTIHQGLSLVLNGILLGIVLGVVGVFVDFGKGASGSSRPELAVAGLELIPSFMILMGYWKYTDPDPSFVGTELPRAARKIMRVAVCIQAVATLASFALTLTTNSTLLGRNVLGSGFTFLELADGIIWFVHSAAWVVQFFATMRYTRWVAGRVPDARVIRRTRIYVWLLPALVSVGFTVFAVGLTVFASLTGMIASVLAALMVLILYWNLLDRLRKQIKTIRSTGAPAALKGSLG